MKFHVGLITELPPRARRILPQRGVALTQGGTTSACAENTPLAPLLVFWWRNYLRVRGEYLPRAPYEYEKMELPPRARRILIGERQVRRYLGTTSACAENTSP